jgi:hypothetical protein
MEYELIAGFPEMDGQGALREASPGYAGEMLDLGADEDFVKEFLEDHPEVHAVSGVRKV